MRNALYYFCMGVAVFERVAFTITVEVHRFTLLAYAACAEDLDTHPASRSACESPPHVLHQTRIDEAPDMPVRVVYIPRTTSQTQTPTLHHHMYTNLCCANCK